MMIRLITVLAVASALMWTAASAYALLYLVRALSSGVFVPWGIGAALGILAIGFAAGAKVQATR